MPLEGTAATLSIIPSMQQASATSGSSLEYNARYEFDLPTLSLPTNFPPINPPSLKNSYPPTYLLRVQCLSHLTSDIDCPKSLRLHESRNAAHTPHHHRCMRYVFLEFSSRCGVHLGDAWV